MPPRCAPEAPNRLPRSLKTTPPEAPERPPKNPQQASQKGLLSTTESGRRPLNTTCSMGRRNERSDPPPHRVRRVRRPRHDLQEFFPLSHLAHALLVHIPFLRALATPPRVLPGARSFRRPGGPGCTMGALWPPFPSQNGPPFTCYVSGRRRALSETSPGAHWAGFGGLLGPSWADLHRP